MRPDGRPSGRVPAGAQRHGEAVRLCVRFLPAAGVGDDRVLERVVAGALRCRCGELRPSVAPTRRVVIAGEPADAAEQREGGRDASGRVEQLVFRQAAVGDQQAAAAVVGVDEGLLGVGADGLLGPRLVGFGQRQRPLDDAEVLLGVGDIGGDARREVGAQPVVLR